MKALVEYDSRFNLNWILTGQGQMFLNDVESSNPKKIYGDGNTTQIGHNNELNSNSNNNSSIIEVELLKKENKSLNKEIKSLNRVIESQEKLISVLEKNQK
jgi:hypothetical protein